MKSPARRRRPLHEHGRTSTQSHRPAGTDGGLDQTLNLITSGQIIIDAIAVQPNGKILIGGFFNCLQGMQFHQIARLNPNGTLDTAFNPSPDNSVDAIAVQPDGKIVVGGEFDIIGQNRKGIACLDPSTGLADSFNANANATTGR